LHNLRQTATKTPNFYAKIYVTWGMPFPSTFMTTHANIPETIQITV